MGVIGVYKDVADIEVCSCTLYLPLLVERQSIGVEIQGIDMERKGIVGLRVVLKVARSELRGMGNGFRWSA